ncbi:hypothetical protein Trydic_g7864 [Trypoxylus dichotomus]
MSTVHHPLPSDTGLMSLSVAEYPSLRSRPSRSIVVTRDDMANKVHDTVLADRRDNFKAIKDAEDDSINRKSYGDDFLRFSKHNLNGLFGEGKGSYRAVLC